MERLDGPGSRPDKPQFSVAEAQPLVRDLFTPRPWIYWLDFLTSITAAWVFFFLTLQQQAQPALMVLCWLVSSCAFLRSILFIHELAHRKKGTFRFFRLVWNLLCGLPLMIPSYTYSRVHNDHHVQRIYGRHDDGEYLPFGARAPRHIIFYLLTVLILPFGFPLRYIVLTPLSLLHPALRRLLWERFSSLTIDFNYRRSAPGPHDDPSWPLQEFGAMLFGWTWIYLIIRGVLGPEVVLLWYAIMVVGFTLNTLRTLGAHAYRNPGDVPMDLSEQFLDSVDIPGNPILTPLWAPVGLRYHATHHLFPRMPYHSLGAAYRRLRDGLPDNTAFLMSTRRGLWDALKRLWQDARASQSTR